MPGDGQGVSVPLSLFSGLVTELSVPDLPEGLSPDNQDVVFLPGSVGSRPGLHKVYATPLSGNVTVVYQKTYVQPNGQPLTLILDSSGNLWKEDVVNAPGTLTLIGNVPPGSYAQSCSAFGREYIAISDGIHGNGVPLQYDGTFLDRVTQDGPGASPTVSNVAPLSAALSNTGTGASVAISTVTPSDPTVITFQQPIYTPTPGGPPTVSYRTVTVTIYTTLTIVTSAPHGLSANALVSFTGVTPSTYNLNNVLVASIVNSTTFKVKYSTTSTTQGTGGNVVIQNPSLVRNNNIVTANASTPHGFQVGWQVQISGFANTTLANISAISRDGNGIVTVVTTTAHGLPQGATVVIAGVTNPDTTYNGTFVVASVISATSFTYSQAGTVSTSGAGTGSVQDVWNTTAFIQSIPTPTTFTYAQLGANDLSNGTGTAQIVGQISPGLHSCVLMFLTRQGYLTAPSQPVQFQANGAQQALVQNISIGPANVVARVLAFTGAGGGNYFTLLNAPLVNGQIVGSALIINDNTSTSATVDFADNTLFGGTGIDIPGRNQFAQVVLGPSAGFFSYASRLFPWGELNKLQNFLNMGFDGGYIPASFTSNPTAAANSGSGTAWSNPTNIESGSSYADVTVAASASSQQLQTSTYGFSVTGTPQNDQVTFQFYWTGTPGATLPRIVVQLLKAGVAVGTAQTIFLSAGNAASSGAPNTVSLTFPISSLAAADVNNSGFGFQIQVFGGSGGAHVFVRTAGMTPVLIPAIPSGWTNEDTTAATGTLIPTTIAGFAYKMVSSAGALDALIEQPAFKDANGIAILQPNTTYIARIDALVSTVNVGGSLVMDFFSPTSGVLATATFLAASLPTTAAFVQATFSGPTPNIMPADTKLRIYLKNVDNGAVITIDEPELAPATKPYLDNTMRGSYVNAPEQFDGVTGVIGPQSDSSPLRCMFELRDFMYMHTAVGLHETVDNGTGEPSTWSVREISQACGALSLKATDPGKLGTGDSGEQWEFTASRSGLYIFWGGETIKISQEIQTIWDSINFSAAQTIFVKNDPVTRRCYVGVPINGATAPNILLVLDYRELNTPQAIAETAPFRQSYSGRILAVEICRKWTRWNVQTNSAELITRAGRVEQLTVGSGNGQTPGTASGFGNIYFFDSTKLTDDDYGQIVPYWTSYFFISDDQAQQLGIDSHRKLATYFTAFLNGVGNTSITPLSDTLANAYPPFAPYPMSASQSHDLEWNINVDGERIAVKIGSTPATGQTDNSFNLQKLCLTLKKHPWSPVRGAF